MTSFTEEDQSYEVTTSKAADVHNPSNVLGGAVSAGHSDLSSIIPKEILVDIELEKSDPSYTPMVTEELMKLKSKEEAEKVHLREEEWQEARCKAQELWAKKKRRKNLKLN